MADREDVIQGLMCHSDESDVYACDKCPYYGNRYCGEVLSKDALALLKAQEPRLMTLEEVKAHIAEIRERGMILGDKYFSFDLVPSFYIKEEEG